jgi:hypothetical protein
LREAEFGNVQQAKKQAAAVLALGHDMEAQTLAALALGRAGDSARALATADGLNRQRPLDTLLNGYWLPTIRAAVEIGRGHPLRAIELLQQVAPYDLSAQYDPGAKLCPTYVRGEAYLALHQGSHAAAEFQKILDHPGIVQNCPLGALAHLGLGRAYALETDSSWERGRPARHWETTKSGRDARAPRRRPRQSPRRLRGLLRPLERRRPRHPHPEAS